MLPCWNLKDWSPVMSVSESVNHQVLPSLPVNLYYSTLIILTHLQWSGWDSRPGSILGPKHLLEKYLDKIKEHAPEPGQPCSERKPGGQCGVWCVMYQSVWGRQSCYISSSSCNYNLKTYNLGPLNIITHIIPTFLSLVRPQSHDPVLACDWLIFLGSWWPSSL